MIMFICVLAGHEIGHKALVSLLVLPCKLIDRKVRSVDKLDSY